MNEVDELAYHVMIVKVGTAEDTYPYQRTDPQAADGEISDAEIKSMFSLMATGLTSG